jgi:hypothetical protein
MDSSPYHSCPDHLKYSRQRMIKLDAATSLKRRKSFIILAVIHKARTQKAAAKEQHLAQEELLAVLIPMTLDRSVSMPSLL